MNLNDKQRLRVAVSTSHLHHIQSLVFVFALWKLLLLFIACASPGPGYDTSTRLLLFPASQDHSFLVKSLVHVSLKLVRWDALYFVRVAHRGYLFEQEWAWGYGWITSISLVARALPLSSPVPQLLREAIAGILISHVFHLLSVITLYALALHILPTRDPHRCKTALLAAALHVISPAGMFLSAPYSESLFAFMTFLGMLSYSQIHSRHCSTIYESAAVLGAGLCWGLASSVRGNGLFNGIILAYRALTLLKAPPSSATALKLCVTVVAGMLVASGLVLPQWIAYQEYCLDSSSSSVSIRELPVWCSRIPPSIYTYVQEHYWNNGFLRYWTLPNIPLFVLALPILCLMVVTAWIAVFQPRVLLALSPSTADHDQDQQQEKQQLDEEEQQQQQRFVNCMRLFSLPQLALAVLALFNFHVQIVNRLSSGYPIWYLVLAVYIMACRGSSSSTTITTSSSSNSSTSTGTAGSATADAKESLVVTMTTTAAAAAAASLPGKLLSGRKTQRCIVSGMLIYAIVQGGLYASFMPPA